MQEDARVRSAPQNRQRALIGVVALLVMLAAAFGGYRQMHSSTVPRSGMPLLSPQKGPLNEPETPGLNTPEDHKGVVRQGG